MSDAVIPVVCHGVVRFLDVPCEAVVLETRERGFVWPHVALELRFDETSYGDRLGLLLGEFAPTSEPLLDEGPKDILLLDGQKGQFCPAGIIGEVASNLFEAALAGRRHGASERLLANCIKVVATLAARTEVELIDEATGYGRHQAPGAVLGRMADLLNEICPAWERRFGADYHRALYRLFRWHFKGQEAPQPLAVEQVTLQWVYRPVLPQALFRHVQSGRPVSQQHRRWLSEEGVPRLQAQIAAVTVIARLSSGYQDFAKRCEAVFATAAEAAAPALKEDA
ncbi:P63C domain-containing protein [Aquabacterium sp. A7-Y]|uniref:P63C domain-containing protein n=1 Tax=Aquabacterium sp. A7-Y TaxID=1349605 RepID=UPI00223D3189|nr:P63C domain-containing protein [Aquabacterium sp. A7-Y]MCW7536249.1 P63C domain-containing protein [Aquabacterium sp. A7-Y]